MHKAEKIRQQGLHNALETNYCSYLPCKKTNMQEVFLAFLLASLS